MNILFIGDIVGKIGRRTVFNLIDGVIETHSADLVIANCENAAGGFGVTPEIVEELLNGRIDLLTTGNHVWDKREIMDYISCQPRLLRPANFPEGAPGDGSAVMRASSGLRVGVINVMCRTFMEPLDCPFRAADSELKRIGGECDVVVVDVHGEATSEKITMGWYLDGRVGAVIGTHTHVQTADERVLPEGTAYITDVGMTGPVDSIIGIDRDIVIQRFLTNMPRRFEVAKGPGQLSAVAIDINPDTGLANDIIRLQLKDV